MRTADGPATSAPQAPGSLVPMTAPAKADQTEEPSVEQPPVQRFEVAQAEGSDSIARRLGSDFTVQSVARIGDSTSIELSGSDLEVQVLYEVHKGDLAVPVDSRTFEAGHSAANGAEAIRFDIGSGASRLQVGLGDNRYVSVSFHASLEAVQERFGDLDQLALDIAESTVRITLPSK